MEIAMEMEILTDESAMAVVMAAPPSPPECRAAGDFPVDEGAEEREHEETASRGTPQQTTTTQYDQASTADAPAVPSGHGAGVLTANWILARLGVFDLLSTKELILRDEQLECIDDACAEHLTSLEILSLSHNRLTSLQGFQHFVNLIELNVNFNRITSLDALQCPSLEKLFIANNHLTDISSLKAFPQLNTLSVYGNLIANLDATLCTCRALPKLAALDLGGNPCAREQDSYKFRVIRLLPRLKTLDGDLVTALDKDLAEEVEAQSNATATIPASSSTTTIGTSRMTMTDAAASSSNSSGFDAFVSPRMPKGNVRLFRDEFLNSNPLLLEYLAAHEMQEEASAAAAPASSTTPDAAADELAASSGGFVDKMRRANPLAEDDQDTPYDDEDYEQDDDDDNKDDHAAPSLVRPSTASSLVVPTSNLGVDPSDPKATIRKLLKHIEVLEQTLAAQRPASIERAEASILEENRRLHIENNNIPILQDEVTMLKRELSRLSVLQPPAPTTAIVTPLLSAESTRLRQLERENDALRDENARLQSQLQQLLAAGSAEAPAAISPSTFAPTASDDLLADSATMDVELTQLILQNEVALDLLHRDLRQTKKEWDEQLSNARERERRRVRPQTALGVSEQQPKRRSEALRHTRQLHTSSGFRHDAEQTRMLHSSDGRATSQETTTGGNTRIFTL